MKIIKVDSYDRELYSDVLVAEKVDKDFGEVIVKFLNKDVTRSDSDYFKLVEDNYELFEMDYGEEENTKPKVSPLKIIKIGDITNSISRKLIAKNVHSYYGKVIVKLLNKGMLGVFYRFELTGDTNNIKPAETSLPRIGEDVITQNKQRKMSGQLDRKGKEIGEGDTIKYMPDVYNFEDNFELYHVEYGVGTFDSGAYKYVGFYLEDEVGNSDGNGVILFKKESIEIVMSVRNYE